MDTSINNSPLDLIIDILFVKPAGGDGRSKVEPTAKQSRVKQPTTGSVEQAFGRVLDLQKKRNQNPAS